MLKITAKLIAITSPDYRYLIETNGIYKRKKTYSNSYFPFGVRTIKNFDTSIR